MPYSNYKENAHQYAILEESGAICGALMVWEKNENIPRQLEVKENMLVNKE